jgi:hypothetical protein
MKQEMKKPKADPAMTTLTTFVVGEKPKDSIIRHKKVGEEKKVAGDEVKLNDGDDNQDKQ